MLSLLLMMAPPHDHVSITEVFPPLGLLLMMTPSENEVVEGDDVAAMWTSTVGLLYGRKA